MGRRVLIGLCAVCAAACMQLSKSEPDPKNELPFGYVDEPKDGTSIDRNVTTHGWAMDDNGVAEIRVFLDNHFVARTTPTEARPDVSKAFPRYAHGKDTHGWTLIVPLDAGVVLGPHTLVYQAVDNQGATRDIGTVNVRLDR